MFFEINTNRILITGLRLLRTFPRYTRLFVYRRSGQWRYGSLNETISNRRRMMELLNTPETTDFILKQMFAYGLR